MELMYFELLRRFNGNIPLLDPVEDMEIEDKLLTKLIKARKDLDSQLAGTQYQAISETQQTQYDRKKQLKDEILELEESIKQASNMIMSTELVSMKRVMRRLELADRNDVPTLKGKVAASISACDEILVTELLFSGFFQEIDAVQVAAVLSCLIYTDTKGTTEGV